MGRRCPVLLLPVPGFRSIRKNRASSIHPAGGTNHPKPKIAQGLLKNSIFLTAPQKCRSGTRHFWCNLGRFCLFPALSSAFLGGKMAAFRRQDQGRCGCQKTHFEFFDTHWRIPTRDMAYLALFRSFFVLSFSDPLRRGSAYRAVRANVKKGMTTPEKRKETTDTAEKALKNP